MHTNGNGNGNGNGSSPSMNGGRPVVSNYRGVWLGDDGAIQHTAEMASQITPRWPLRETVFHMLNLLKWARKDIASAQEEGALSRWAVEELFEHAIQQQREIAFLEQEMAELQANVSYLLEREANGRALDALDALEDGAELEETLDRMRQPVTEAEERLAALAEMEPQDRDGGRV